VAGSLGHGIAQQWGWPNLWWWADREKGVAGMVCTQILPFADVKVFELWKWQNLCTHHARNTLLPVRPPPQIRQASPVPCASLADVKVFELWEAVEAEIYKALSEA
jgi:hypothetical protein